MSNCDCKARRLAETQRSGNANGSDKNPEVGGAVSPEPPAGWKLVPVEPTQEMLAASWATANPRFIFTDHEEHIAAAYRAMLGAVPAPAGLPLGYISEGARDWLLQDDPVQPGTSVSLWHRNLRMPGKVEVAVYLAPAGLHKLPVSFLVEEPGDSDHQTESSAQAVQRAAIDLLRMAVAHIDNLEGCLEDLASLGATVAICGSTYDRAAINTVLEKS